MPDFVIKQNDTSPAIQVRLLDAEDNAVNLDSATVKFHMSTIDQTLRVNADAVIVDVSSATVEYRWAPEDTAEAGIYIAEFEVTYSDGTVETFPNDGYITVKIVKDLNS